MDLVKYFDSENLIDTLNELYRGKVQGKLYSLLYEMNRDVTLRVTSKTSGAKAHASEVGLVFKISEV